MSALLLAALLVPAAARAQPDGSISDPGDGFTRSTLMAPAASTAPAAGAAAEPASAAPAAAPATVEPATTPSYSELQEATDAPGRLIRGRGGDPYPTRPGGAVLLDAEGRRLEILPSSSRFSTASEPAAGTAHARRADQWSGPLRALTVLGAAVALLLTAWLWRRREV